MATAPVEFPFDFRVRRPEGPLGLAVEQVWYARGPVPYRDEPSDPTGYPIVIDRQVSATGLPPDQELDVIVRS